MSQKFLRWRKYSQRLWFKAVSIKGKVSLCQQSQIFVPHSEVKTSDLSQQTLSNALRTWVRTQESAVMTQSLAMLIIQSDMAQWKKLTGQHAGFKSSLIHLFVVAVDEFKNWFTQLEIHVRHPPTLKHTQGHTMCLILWELCRGLDERMKWERWFCRWRVEREEKKHDGGRGGSCTRQCTTDNQISLLRQ